MLSRISLAYIRQGTRGGTFCCLGQQLWLFGSIAIMNRKASIPALRDQKPTWANAAALAKKWKFT
jgi:hypothetical protein